jgi:hypothetical protein
MTTFSQKSMESVDTCKQNLWILVAQSMASELQTLNTEP